MRERGELLQLIAFARKDGEPVDELVKELAQLDQQQKEKTQNSIPKKQNNQLKTFIPSVLDEYGLKPSVFRVYCHIARRDGGEQGAWASVASIARTCQIHPQTVRKALKFLVTEEFLTRQTRRGATTIYRLTPMYMWQNQRRK